MHTPRRHARQPLPPLPPKHRQTLSSHISPVHMCAHVPFDYQTIFRRICALVRAATPARVIIIITVRCDCSRFTAYRLHVCLCLVVCSVFTTYICRSLQFRILYNATARLFGTQPPPPLISDVGDNDVVTYA